MLANRTSYYKADFQKILPLTKIGGRNMNEDMEKVVKILRRSTIRWYRTRAGEYLHSLEYRSRKN